MIEKDYQPIDAVTPGSKQRLFLERIIQETSEYARSRNLTDMYFQGHNDQAYFGAYSTQQKHIGAGKFIFGFDRRAKILRMAIPIGISEPYRLAKSWTGDPSRNRAVIDLDIEISEEFQLYLIEMGKRSIDFHYKGNRG
jgi:hypothetical protein